jgi:adenylate cyclase
MVIAKMQTPPDEASAAAHLKAFEEKGPEVQREAEAARKLIKAIIDDPSTPSDNVALTRIDERIDTAVNDLRHRLNEEIGQLLRQLEGRNFTEVLHGLARVDALRDEFNQKMDVIRADMLGTRERLNSCPQSAASHMDFGNCDGNCCCTRIGVCDAGWQRNHPSSVSIARGHTGG